jgi:hypothetical protein
LGFATAPIKVVSWCCSKIAVCYVLQQCIACLHISNATLLGLGAALIRVVICCCSFPDIVLLLLLMLLVLLQGLQKHQRA